MSRGKLQTAFGFVGLFVILAAGGWFIYSFFKLDPAIQSAILALIGVSASAIITNWFAKKREIESRHFTEKRDAYEKFMDIMFEVLMSTKVGRKTPENQLVKKFLECKKTILVWANARVIKAWNDAESSWASANQDPMASLLMWSRLMKEMRKDLGKNDSELEDGDLVRLILKAEEKHKVKG